MNALILAAGYATRLHPLTLNRPKPLLEVAGKPMIEWVLDNLADIPDLENVYVVTNHKFVAAFENWAAGYQRRKPKFLCKIVDDGSTSDADKLGAIGDLHFVLNRESLFAEDLLVVAGDNLFSQSIAAFAAAGPHAPATLGIYDVGDLELVKKYNSITTDADGRITHFEEKPSAPSHTKSGIALYYYRKDTLPLINTYITEGNNPDQPGRLIQWLYPRLEVWAWEVPGLWFDIGDKENLDEAGQIFRQFQTPR